MHFAAIADIGGNNLIIFADVRSMHTSASCHYYAIYHHAWAGKRCHALLPDSTWSCTANAVLKEHPCLGALLSKLADLGEVEEGIACSITDAAHASSRAHADGRVSTPAQQVQRTAATEHQHHRLAVGEGIPAHNEPQPTNHHSSR